MFYFLQALSILNLIKYKIFICLFCFIHVINVQSQSESNKTKYAEIEVKNEKEALEATRAIYSLKSKKLMPLRGLPHKNPGSYHLLPEDFLATLENNVK